MSVISRASVAPVRTRRRRSFVTLAGVAVLATAFAGCLNAEEQTFLDRANALRASQGVAPLADHEVLNQKADQLARHMAETGALEHSRLTDSLDGLQWSALAENVGMSSPTDDTLRTIHDLLASSRQHRANMVNEQFDHMGVGVAESADGRVWVAEVFADL